MSETVSSQGTNEANSSIPSAISTKESEKNESPSNRVCMVCFDGAEYSMNPLLCCSIPECRMLVHLACYGSGTGYKPISSYKKRSKWICDVCVLDKQADNSIPQANRTCTVCKMGGGVLKPTKEADKVCHLVCVRWLPELKQVPSEVYPETSVVDAGLLFGTRKSLKCTICQKRNGCLQCMSKRCTKAYHTVCALRAPESKVYTGTTETNQLACFCDNHLDDVKGTFRSIKDIYWNQPYTGQEIDDEFDEEDTEPVPSAVNARIAPPGITIPEPYPSSLIPTPGSLSTSSKKGGRPRKNASVIDPSMPKPTLPPPPGQFLQPPVAQLPSPHAFTTTPSINPSPRSNFPASNLPDVAVCQMCMQPVARSMLYVHQQSMCSSRFTNTSFGPKDMTKKPRGRPPGSTNRPKDQADMKISKNVKPNMQFSRPMAMNANMMRPTGAFVPRPLVNPQIPKQVNMAVPRSTPGASHAPRPMGYSMVKPQLPYPERDVLMDNAIDALRSISVDPLFTTWPGLQGGGLMQTADFWNQVFLAFFPKLSASPSKWTPITQWLAGVSVQAFGQPLKPPGKCTEAVQFENVTTKWLASSSVEHTCDSMIQSHGNRCPQPLRPFTHVKSIDISPRERTGVLDVAFASHNDQTIHCRFAVVCADHAPSDTPEYPGLVWTRFRSNKDIKLPGQDETLPTTPIWVALLSNDTMNDFSLKDGYDSNVQLTESPICDDMALESLLCYELLQEQLKSNRMRWRNLWMKAHKTNTAEVSTNVRNQQIEHMYKEYMWWRSICVNMIKGMRDSPYARDESGNITDSLQPFEDGTCVVCMDGMSEDSNPIIFCDKCDLAVHQHCYGIQTIPKSDFYCDRCAAKEPVQCALCPNTHGAFKKTIEGKWVHMVCALWCPTTFLMKVPKMLFQLSPDDTKVRYASFDVLASTCKLSDVAGIPDAIQSGDLCRICRVDTGCTIKCRDCPASFHPLCAWFEGYHMQVDVASCGYVCAGGGKGLKFTLTCLEHTPTSLPSQDRALQRATRLKLCETNVPRRSCGICFKGLSNLHPHSKFEALPTTHFFIRCVECYVECHSHCVYPKKLTAPWKCERCRVATPLSKAASITCLLCEQSTGYMIPIEVPPSAPDSTALPSSTNLTPALPNQTPSFVHLICADAFLYPVRKSPTGRTIQVSAWEPPTSKCNLCNKRSGRLVGCSHKNCATTFHPYCYAKANYFSHKVKGKSLYYCSSHPPEFAVFDTENESWITQETLMALQEVRCSLERVRMFIDLSKQREKTKKRMFLNGDSVALQKALTFVHVQKPTQNMKTVYKNLTREDMEDITRPKPVEPSPKKRRTIRGNDSESQETKIEEIWLQELPANAPDMNDLMAEIYPTECQN